MVCICGRGDFTNYCRALEQQGQRALIGTDGALAHLCGGLLLPGGGDIHGALDGGETALIQYFIDTGRPILGICRGMQALNVFFGGTLHDLVPGHQIPEGDMTHPTHGEGPAAILLGETAVVNSNHHQAVDMQGRGLVACRWADDGVVETIIHESLPILGVQYHPERMGDAGAPVFRWFCERIRK